MPIVVKDYSWSESESSIELEVPLKGASAKSLSVYGKFAHRSTGRLAL